MEYTEIQQQAIAHEKGPCLLLAVPGAGKTTVLLARLHALRQKGILPEHIASITFSRRQAQDMQERYQQKYGDATNLTFSTIHAFCYRILRMYAKKHGVSLQLMEGASPYNKYRVIESLYREQQHRFMTEEEKEDFFRIDGFLKNSLLTFGEYRKTHRVRFPHFESLQKAYQTFKYEHNLIDFDDMLVRTLQVLDSDAQLLQQMRNRFTYYQVDEAQDTSLIQLRILLLLAAPKQNLFMVADDDQSIYGFRGANPQYLLQFQQSFPDGKILLMQDNYRSTRNIVGLASDLIQRNKARYQKKPITKTRSSERTQVILSKTLTSQTHRLLQDLPEDLARGSVAILYRNHYSELPLVDVLDRKGIAFQLRGNTLRYFHHPVVADILDFLKLANNPSDSESFYHIYYKTNQFLKKEFADAVINGSPSESVWDKLAALPETQNRFYQEKLSFLYQSFTRIAQLPPEKSLEFIYHHLYQDFLKERTRRSVTAGRGDQRIFEWLLFTASLLSPEETLEHRLQSLENLITNHSGVSAPLTLSTVHAAKGLEFDTVWLIDLIQGEFPSSSAIEEEKMGDVAAMEEERRLFYVGMTRAKKKLRLMGRKSIHGQKTEYSQFIDEVAKRNKNK